VNLTPQHDMREVDPVIETRKYMHIFSSWMNWMNFNAINSINAYQFIFFSPKISCLELRQEILHTVLDHWNTCNSKILGLLIKSNCVCACMSGVNFAVIGRVYICDPNTTSVKLTLW
jgi:hypothetical protein